MAYTPPTPLPSVPVTTPMGATGGAGTFTAFDYSSHLNAIIVELNQLNYNLSSISTAEPGSVMAQVSLTNTNLKDTLSQYGTMIETLQKLTGAITSMNKTMNVQTTGLANIAGTLSKQLVVQEVAVMDQVKNNEFQQETTRQAQRDAGKEPTVVQPQALLAKIQSGVNEVLTFRAETFAANLVSSTINDTITTAYTTSVTWAGQTAVGQWIQTTYAETEIFITSIFSKEKAEKLRIELQNKLKNAEKNPAGTTT